LFIGIDPPTILPAGNVQMEVATKAPNPARHRQRQFQEVRRFPPPPTQPKKAQRT